MGNHRKSQKAAESIIEKQETQSRPSGTVTNAMSSSPSLHVSVVKVLGFRQPSGGDVELYWSSPAGLTIQPCSVPFCHRIRRKTTIEVYKKDRALCVV